MVMLSLLPTTIADNNLAASVKEHNKKVESIIKWVSINAQINVHKARYLVKRAMQSAYNNGVDPVLFVSLVFVESHFNEKAKSSVGAIGLTQVLAKFHKKTIGKRNLWKAEHNLDIGATILKQYMIRYRSTDIALAAYNGTIGKRKYVNKVLQVRSTLDCCAT
jgi:soluble lytic murein transglycosylase-like protein